MNEDYLLDEDEDDLDSQIIDNTGDDDEEGAGEDEGGSESGSGSLISVSKNSGPAAKSSDYKGRMTDLEIEMSSLYNNVALSNQKNRDKVKIGGRVFDANIVDAVVNVLKADPKNTSSLTIKNFEMTLFHNQAHTSIVASVYQPEMLRSDELGDEFGGTEDPEFNEKFKNALKDQVDRFVKYLAGRDLSRDSIRSRNYKRRQLPAFIIYLFSSGLYDLVMNCPSMPPEYQSQIDNAMKRLNQNKYNLVEDLAKAYEERKKPDLAEAVRRLNLAWFNREPAELTTLKTFKNLNITPEDVLLYKEYRSKFMNLTKSITLDVISKLILVVLDKDAGIYEELKDKTRTDAINDVKQLYKKWSSENPIDSELSDEIIWGDRSKLQSGGKKSKIEEAVQEKEKEENK